MTRPILASQTGEGQLKTDLDLQQVGERKGCVFISSGSSLPFTVFSVSSVSLFPLLYYIFLSFPLPLRKVAQLFTRVDVSLNRNITIVSLLMALFLMTAIIGNISVFPCI